MFVVKPLVQVSRNKFVGITHKLKVSRTFEIKEEEVTLDKKKEILLKVIKKHLSLIEELGLESPRIRAYKTHIKNANKYLQLYWEERTLAEGLMNQVISEEPEEEPEEPEEEPEEPVEEVVVVQEEVKKLCQRQMTEFLINLGKIYYRRNEQIIKKMAQQPITLYLKKPEEVLARYKTITQTVVFQDGEFSSSIGEFSLPVNEYTIIEEVIDYKNKRYILYKDRPISPGVRKKMTEVEIETVIRDPKNAPGPESCWWKVSEKVNDNPETPMTPEDALTDEEVLTDNEQVVEEVVEKKKLMPVDQHEIIQQPITLSDGKVLMLNRRKPIC